MKLKEVLDIALLADAVIKNPGLKFKADAEVASLAHHCKRIIECEIGPEMKKLNEQERPITEVIKAPFQAKIDKMIEDKADEQEIEKESKAANAMILKAVGMDERISLINQQRDLLWEKDFDGDIPVVDIENMEYWERFPEDVVDVAFMNGSLKITGYNALRSLIARKVVNIL
jgi:hypothetical protein